jgi:hypothetical protein
MKLPPAQGGQTEGLAVGISSSSTDCSSASSSSSANRALLARAASALAGIKLNIVLYAAVFSTDFLDSAYSITLQVLSRKCCYDFALL